MECLLAAGVKRQLRTDAGSALEAFQHFIDEKQSWLFGHLGYDLKNEIEKVVSANPDRIGFPDLFFFEPEIIIRLSATEIIIEANDPSTVFDAITKEPEIYKSAATFNKDIEIENRISRLAYIAIINKFQQG